jgi:group I intron endonuclease
MQKFSNEHTVTNTYSSSDKLRQRHIPNSLLTSFKVGQPSTPLNKVKHYSSSSLPPTPVRELKLSKEFEVPKDLKNKGGIYCFHNTVDGKRYIGSAKDLYLRLKEHLNGKKSNIALQRAIEKHGLDNFCFYVFEYFDYVDANISHEAITDLETAYINKFSFIMLYNFMRTATSSLGYKHTEEAKLKMSQRLADKTNHPMFGKTHSKEALALISKPGELNPMYGKKHSEETKLKMRQKKNKYINGVGIYDLEGNLIEKFNNNVDLAAYLGISKVTAGKYLNSGKIYNKIYLFKPIE